MLRRIYNSKGNNLKCIIQKYQSHQNKLLLHKHSHKKQKKNSIAKYTNTLFNKSQKKTKPTHKVTIHLFNLKIHAIFIKLSLIKHFIVHYFQCIFIHFNYPAVFFDNIFNIFTFYFNWCFIL